MIAAITQAEALRKILRHKRPLFTRLTSARMPITHKDWRALGYGRWVSSAAFNPVASARVGPTPQ
jgi:hypothetical protein